MQKRTKGWLAMRGMWGRKKRGGPAAAAPQVTGEDQEHPQPSKRDILRLEDSDLQEIYNKAFQNSKQ